MGGRRRPVTGRLYAGKGAAAEIRSPLILVPPITAMEEGAGGGAGAGPLASSSAATPKAAAPVDRYHLAYAIFYLQVRLCADVDCDSIGPNTNIEKGGWRLSILLFNSYHKSSKPPCTLT